MIKKLATCSWVHFTTCCDGSECSTEYIHVVLRKSPTGFGMTMSGSDPVIIQNLQEGNCNCACLNVSRFLFCIRLP